MEKTRIVAPGPESNKVRTESGEILTVPATWKLLPPGDAGLTRRVKAAGPSWTVQERKGRKVFSKGVWAPAENIDAASNALEKERSTEAYAKRKLAAAVKRNNEQSEYVREFESAVLKFLRFHEKHQTLAQRLAKAVTEHATPVGSGTVARTERIPIERRAESAVIAWLRHQTTEYDDMKIQRVRGRRREVRRELAGESRELLQQYRLGKEIPQCALTSSLDDWDQAQRDASEHSVS